MDSSKSKLLVARGYDMIGEAYGHQSTRSRTEQRSRYEAVMLHRLPAGAPSAGPGLRLRNPHHQETRTTVSGYRVRPVNQAGGTRPRQRPRRPVRLCGHGLTGVCAWLVRWRVRLLLDDPPAARRAGTAFEVDRRLASTRRLLVCSLGTPPARLISNNGGWERACSRIASTRPPIEIWSRNRGSRPSRRREETTSARAASETFLWVVAAQSSVPVEVP